MLFSIILPVYNVEKYLCECVESILKQTYKDYEIILVDDGSTDKSPEICDSFSEQNPCVKTVHKKNGGLSDARNAGTKTARGEYIIYIDSDDFVIAEDFLEKLADKTKNSPDLILYKYSKYYDTQKRLADCTFSLKSAADKVSYADKIHSLAKYYSNLFVCYARLGDSRKKEYKDRIKRLDRLFDFAMSKKTADYG